MPPQYIPDSSSTNNISYFTKRPRVLLENSFLCKVRKIDKKFYTMKKKFTHEKEKKKNSNNLLTAIWIDRINAFLIHIFLRCFTSSQNSLLLKIHVRFIISYHVTRKNQRKEHKHAANSTFFLLFSSLYLKNTKL